MSYQTREINQINVIGTMWMPAITSAYVYPLDKHDLQNIIEQSEKETIEDCSKEDFEYWLAGNSGDFQKIIDFQVDVKDFLYDWDKEDSESIFSDCMYPYD